MIKRKLSTDYFPENKPITNTNSKNADKDTKIFKLLDSLIKNE